MNFFTFNNGKNHLNLNHVVSARFYDDGDFVICDIKGDYFRLKDLEDIHQFHVKTGTYNTHSYIYKLLDQDN